MSNEITDSERAALKELKEVARADDSFFKNISTCIGLALEWANHSRGRESIPEGRRSFFEKLLVVYGGLESISTIVYRLEWLKGKFLSERDLLRPEEFMEFFQADVYAFYTEFGSLVDSLCPLIKFVSLEPDLMPSGSLKDLRDWLIETSDGSLKLSPPEIANIIVAADWIPAVGVTIEYIKQRQVGIIVGVTEPLGEILFSIFCNSILFDCSVQEERDAQFSSLFRPQVGYFFGRFLFLLERLCVVAATNLDISLDQIAYPLRLRLSTIRECIDFAIATLEAGQFKPNDFAGF
jgi:hypothetical protein